MKMILENLLCYTLGILQVYISTEVFKIFCSDTSKCYTIEESKKILERFNNIKNN